MLVLLLEGMLVFVYSCMISIDVRFIEKYKASFKGMCTFHVMEICLNAIRLGL